MEIRTRTKIIFTACVVLIFALLITIYSNRKSAADTNTSSTTPIEQTASMTDSVLASDTTVFSSEISTTKATEKVSTEQITLPIVTEVTTATKQVATTVPSAETYSDDDINLFKQILTVAGYAYNAEENIFYTTENPWQKQFGYSKFYDLVSAFGQMVYDTVRFKFNYDNRSWMFQIWKGRYVFTSGCEIGIYTKDINLPDADYWEGVGPEDYIGLEVNMYRYDNFYFHRGPEKHWWLTGFRVADIVYSEGLNMQAIFTMDDRYMANAFELSIRKVMEDERDDVKYIRNSDNVITVYWGELIDEIFPELQ